MRLPYFPLHVVAFPRMPLPLHIFEERYRLMTADLVADDSPFDGRLVIAKITSGSESRTEDEPQTETVGTVVQVPTHLIDVARLGDTNVAQALVVAAVVAIERGKAQDRDEEN